MIKVNFCADEKNLKRQQDLILYLHLRIVKFAEIRLLINKENREKNNNIKKSW